MTYLFGHPDGPKRRYKNVIEFLPHLMWLAADRAHKKANCACIFCKGSGRLDKRTPSPPPVVVSSVSQPVVPANGLVMGLANARLRAAKKNASKGKAPAESTTTNSVDH